MSVTQPTAPADLDRHALNERLAEELFGFVWVVRREGTMGGRYLVPADRVDAHEGRVWCRATEDEPVSEVGHLTGWVPDYLHPDGRGLVPMLEALRERGWRVSLWTGVIGQDAYYVGVIPPGRTPEAAGADTPALALALAALRALEGER